MLGNYLLHTTFQKVASLKSLGKISCHYTENCFNFEINGTEYMRNCQLFKKVSTPWSCKLVSGNGWDGTQNLIPKKSQFRSQGTTILLK